MDILIDKPPSVRGYALHRIVQMAQAGRPALWADEGSQVRIRPTDAAPPRYEAGKLLAFTTTACVALRSGGKHRYLPVNDWRGRRAWFEKEAAKHGFEILGVHVAGGMRKIEAHDGRRFTVDATEFTGLLRVVDADAFANCLTHGLGRVGNAFGLNLLIVD